MDEEFVYQLLKRLYARLDALERRVERLESTSIPARDPKEFNGDYYNMDDDLYEDAKNAVVEAGKATASLLQRRLQIGYARAARLLDILEEQGIIGPADGAKPRDVLIG